MIWIVMAALLLALLVYISVGLVLGRETKGLGDLLPLGFGRRARVESSREFSASTVATTISLATVVIAFFELAGQFGVWLFWTVLTTSAGLLLVRLFAQRIWRRMEAYDHRPTLHEFLGTEFNSEALSYVSAACNSLGFLAAFAVELTVGSRFFAWLVPEVPTEIVVVVLSVVAFVYTAVGGFRAVIVTDRIQMVSIRALLVALPLFYLYYVNTHGGWQASIDRIPPAVLFPSFRPGLVSFLIGILIINVPTYISDMSIWQRIAGSQKPETVAGGLLSSVISSAVTWSMFALLACFSFMMIRADSTNNPLGDVLQVVGQTGTFFSGVVLFVAVLGLYGAMLSTASTQLIAVSHAVYEDVFSRRRKEKLGQRMESARELRISRTILVMAALLSTVLVQVLSTVGFSIADLVFAIYGSQVGLCPLAISALLLRREQLRRMSDWAASAVTAGFVLGWGSAFFGVMGKNENLVFLAPVFSLLVSGMLLGAGFIVSGAWKARPS
ncbi:MAG: hypothetical protein JW828_12955 [Sedimentisphaerales bacterium]|nr:hypothetical protein [Sedimentisphaerales bacterium]